MLLAFSPTRGCVSLLHRQMSSPATCNLRLVTCDLLIHTNVISVTSGGQLNRTGAVTPRPTVVYNQVFATR